MLVELADARSASRRACPSTRWCACRARRSSALPPVDPLELVRMIATARILMPRSKVRLSAGRTELGARGAAPVLVRGREQHLLRRQAPHDGQPRRRGRPRAPARRGDEAAGIRSLQSNERRFERCVCLWRMASQESARLPGLAGFFLRPAGPPDRPITSGSSAAHHTGTVRERRTTSTRPTITLSPVSVNGIVRLPSRARTWMRPVMGVWSSGRVRLTSMA